MKRAPKACAPAGRRGGFPLVHRVSADAARHGIEQRLNFRRKLAPEAGR